MDPLKRIRSHFTVLYKTHSTSHQMLLVTFHGILYKLAYCMSKEGTYVAYEINHLLIVREIIKMSHHNTML